MRKQTRRQIRVESLESRQCLSASGFDFMEIETDLSDLWFAPSTVDLDGDGDIDVIAAMISPSVPRTPIVRSPDVDLLWFENEGSGQFREGEILFEELSNGSLWELADIDSDGDADMILTDGETNDLNVLKFSDGGFGIPKRVGNGGAVTSADIDADGDIDFVSRVPDGNRELIELYINEDGDGTFALHDFGANDRDSLIPSFVAGEIEFADVDGDGDLDGWSVATINENWTEATYFENVDGEFAQGRVVVETAIRTIGTLTDLDSDGDLDFLTSTSDLDPDVDDDSAILWHENLGGFSFNEHVISELDASYIFPHAGDLDADGDNDFVVAIDGRLALFTNDGDEDFQQRFLMDDLLATLPISLSDLDGDDDLDIFTTSFIELNWFQARPAGDANGDGKFDSSDLVLVFQNNQYEDAIENNSTFADGDWNGDREFNTKDLIFAFAAGCYED